MSAGRVFETPELSVQIKKSLIRAELIQNVIFFKISMQNILFEILLRWARAACLRPLSYVYCFFLSYIDESLLLLLQLREY